VEPLPIGGCARRSTPGFVFFGTFLAATDARSSQVFRKEEASMEIGAPDGIRANALWQQ